MTTEATAIETTEAHKWELIAEMATEMGHHAAVIAADLEDELISDEAAGLFQFRDLFDQMMEARTALRSFTGLEKWIECDQSYTCSETFWTDQDKAAHMVLAH